MLHRLPSLVRVKHGHFDLDRSEGHAVLTLLNAKPPPADYEAFVSLLTDLPFKLHTVVMWAHDEGTLPVLLGSHWEHIRVLEPKCKLATNVGIYRGLLSNTTNATELTFAPAAPGQVNAASPHVDDLLEYGKGLKTLHIGGIGKITIFEDQLSRIIGGLNNLSSVSIQVSGDCTLDTMVRVLASTHKVWEKIEWGFIDPAQLAQSMNRHGLLVKQFVYFERTTAITVTVGYGKIPLRVAALEKMVADSAAERV